LLIVCCVFDVRVLRLAANSNLNSARGGRPSNPPVWRKCQLHVNAGAALSARGCCVGLSQFLRQTLAPELT
jgi:hypothetical protein